MRRPESAASRSRPTGPRGDEVPPAAGGRMRTAAPRARDGERRGERQRPTEARGRSRQERNIVGCSCASSWQAPLPDPRPAGGARRGARGAVATGRQTRLVILGTSLGLLLAHWFAFRLATRITAGRCVVALCGSGGRRQAVRRALRGPARRGPVRAPRRQRRPLDLAPALAALSHCRSSRPLGGRSWVFALTTGGVTLVVALAVVVLKNFLGH